MGKNRRELSPKRLKRSKTGQTEYGSASASSVVQGVQVSEQGSQVVQQQVIGRDELGNVPSLVLLEASFNDFLKNAKDLEKLEEEDIEAADELCKQLSSREFVSNHEDRVEYIQEVLTDYWKAFVHATSIGNVTIDATVVIHQAVALILEFKSVVGNSSGDPCSGGVDYIRRCCSKSAGRKNPCSQYGLLLCFAGANMQVSGYFYDAMGGKVWCEPLTWSFCYGPSNNVKACAAVLRAVKLFCGSYVSETSSVPWRLRCLESVVQRRNLFVYVGWEKNMLVAAKYVRTYSEEAHRAWSEAGVAPNLFKVEENVADGWMLLHMEYLLDWTSADKLVREHKQDADFIGRLSQQIEKAARLGHQAGFVHGDLRLSNILVETTTMTVKVVDFGWAGAIGKATYPEVPNKRHCWPPGVKYKQPILADHDLWFARHLVEQLGPK